MDVNFVTATSQHITVRITFGGSFSVLASFVYAKCSRGNDMSYGQIFMICPCSILSLG